MFKYAAHEDVNRCLTCALNFANHYGLELDLESTAITLHHLVDNGVFIIAESNNTVIGIAGAAITPNPWNYNKVIYQELFWWVEPEYRNTSTGIKLLKLLENKAPVNAIVSLSILPNSNIKETTLNKLGYFAKETAYIRN
jgi:hypothetical protein